MKTIVNLILLLVLIGIVRAETCTGIRGTPDKIPVDAVIDMGAVCDERNLRKASFSKSGCSKLMGFFTTKSKETRAICPIQLVKKKIARCRTLAVAITLRNGDKNKRKRFTCTARALKEDGTAPDSGTATVGGSSELLGGGVTETYFFKPIWQSTGGLYVECTLPRKVRIVQIAHFY